MKRANKIIPILVRLTLVLSLIVVFISCKRTKEPLLGSEYRPAGKEFYVVDDTLKINNTNLRLNQATGAAVFLAKFSHPVSWTITVRGEDSGAEKVIQGLSDTLNAKNALWDGSSSNGYFFKRGENIKATLSFLGSSLTYSVSARIVAEKMYNNKIFNNVKYLVLDDFETPDVMALAELNSGSADPLDGDTYFGTDDEYRVEGNFSYKMKGTDLNSNYYMGAVSSNDLTGLRNKIETQNSDSLFFNMYVYGTGSANTGIQVKAYEIDKEEHLNDPTYVFNAGENDGWTYDLVVDWTGWKLISLQYSKFKRAKDPAYGGNGNGVKEPHKLGGFALSLISYPQPKATGTVYMDFVTLTQNGPFIP